jgi:hypothetical protein
MRKLTDDERKVCLTAIASPRDILPNGEIDEARLTASALIGLAVHMGTLRNGVQIDTDPTRVQAWQWLKLHEQDMPPHLFACFKQALYEQRAAALSRGRRPPNTARDQMLIMVIAILVEECGLPATRNKQPRKRKKTALRRSACSIVSEVLAEHGIQMSERAVEAILPPKRRLKEFAELFGTN